MTGANALPDAAACSPALALRANQTPPSVVAVAAVDDAVGGASDAYVDLLVAFAPLLVLAANLQPEHRQCGEFNSIQLIPQKKSVTNWTYWIMI